MIKTESEVKKLLAEKASSYQTKKRRNRRIALTVVPVFIICLTAVLLLSGQRVVADEDLMSKVTPKKVTGLELDERFADAQTALSLELLNRCMAKKPVENMLISPISVSSALAMTMNGANGETLNEMQNVLGDLTREEWNKYFYSYRNSCTTDDSCKVRLANSIWIRNNPGIVVQDSFLQTNADYYGAGAYLKPFNETTVYEINNWVNVKTDGMIPQIIDSISPETQIELINALSFDGTWETCFRDDQVSSGYFHNEDGTTSVIDMMYTEENISLSFKDATGFLKPYDGGRYAFAAILPNVGADFSEFCESLTAAQIRQALENASEEEVKIGIPKFSIDCENRLEDVLRDMGMKQAFSSSEADFSGICEQPLKIGSVLHKTHIEINEQGTKAAAVTDIFFDRDWRMAVLDRPFVYMILDLDTNTPLFIGCIRNAEKLEA